VKIGGKTPLKPALVGFISGSGSQRGVETLKRAGARVQISMTVGIPTQIRVDCLRQPELFRRGAVLAPSRPKEPRQPASFRCLSRP